MFNLEAGHTSYKDHKSPPGRQGRGRENEKRERGEKKRQVTEIKQEGKERD